MIFYITIQNKNYYITQICDKWSVCSISSSPFCDILKLLETYEKQICIHSFWYLRLSSSCVKCTWGTEDTMPSNDFLRAAN